MKKSIGVMKFFVTVLLSTMILSGCGETGNNAETPGGTSEVDVGDIPLEDTGKKVTVVSWQTALSDQNQQILDAYYEEFPEAPEIEFVYVGDNQTDNYYTQVDLQLMSGEEIDVVMAGSYIDHAQRAATNVYLPMDVFFEDEGISPTEEYISSFIAPVNDEIYGLPGDGKHWLVYINQDLLEKAGLDLPPFDWTWDDFAEYAETLTTDEAYGSYFHTWDHLNYINMFSVKLGNPIMDNEDYTLEIDHPKLVEFLEFRKNLDDAGFSTPYNTIIATQSTYRDRFFNGEIAMLPMGSFLIGELEDTTSFPHDFVTTFASMPRDSESPAGRTQSESNYYSIAAESDNPKAAYDFIRFYTTEGAKIKGTDFPVKEGENVEAYINSMVDDDTLVDTEQLAKVFNHEDFTPNPNTNAPSYQKEIGDIIIEEAEKFYLGETSIDEAVSNMMQRGEAVQDRNQ